jgi:GMP synthase (glutamine-hydrolysing)
MKQLLIIKVGETFPSLVSRRGDFEDWILVGMGVDINNWQILDVRNGGLLPPYDSIGGLVIIGFHAMVTDHEDWSERIADWLPGVVEEGIPTLGICYGHQLLAYAMGGEVGDSPNGLEFGTVDVFLNGTAGNDALFGALPSPIQGPVCHAQSVLSLPPGARLLASSAMDPHSALVLGDCAWGVQFHPEFDRHILVEYIRTYRRALQTQGNDPDLLIRDSRYTAYGPELLRRFSEIVREREDS